MQPYSIDIVDFKPGQIVKKMSQFMAPGDYYGTVLAVYPKLNALDVEWPLGTYREFPEDLLVINPREAWAEPHTIQSSLSKIASKYDQRIAHLNDIVFAQYKKDESNISIKIKDLLGSKVASNEIDNAIEKVSLYWNEKGRKYRKSQEELDGTYKCPKCGNLGMKKTRYKHMVNLYGCPKCLFLIKEDDIY